MSNRSSAANSPLKRRTFSKELPIDSHVEYETELNKNLDKSWREKAEKELGENEDAPEKIQQLRHMLTCNGRRDDAFLLRFLRAKKFDVDKALKMIQKYFLMKQQNPELFHVSPPSDLQFMLEMQIQTMLPQKDGQGRQIYIFRVEKCDPYRIPVDFVFRSNVLALEEAIRSPETQIGGLCVLLDMAGLGFSHARYLSPHLAKKTVEVVQEVFPLRFKAFHVLHEPFYFDAILAVLKPFLKDKIRRRIHLHGNDLSSLHKHISKDVLPLEYGGTQPFDNTAWRTKILDNEDYFIKLETYGNHINLNNNNDEEIWEDTRSRLTVSEYELDGENDNKSMDVEVDGNSLHYIDSEDSEYEDGDKRILSPKHKPLESLEELFLKNDFFQNILDEKNVEGV